VLKSTLLLERPPSSISPKRAVVPKAQLPPLTATSPTLVFMYKSSISIVSDEPAPWEFNSKLATTEVSPVLPATNKFTSVLAVLVSAPEVIWVLKYSYLALPVIKTSAITAVPIVAATAAINNCFFILFLQNLVI